MMIKSALSPKPFRTLVITLPTSSVKNLTLHQKDGSRGIIGSFGLTRGKSFGSVGNPRPEFNPGERPVSNWFRQPLFTKFFGECSRLCFIDIVEQTKQAGDVTDLC